MLFKNEIIISDIFLAISANLEQILFLNFWQIFYPGWGGLKKSKKYFRPIFSPFRPIWNNFVFFFILTQFFSGGGGLQFVWLHISSSWVICSWHTEFQLN